MGHSLQKKDQSSSAQTNSWHYVELQEQALAQLTPLSRRLSDMLVDDGADWPLALVVVRELKFYATDILRVAARTCSANRRTYSGSNHARVAQGG